MLRLDRCWLGRWGPRDFLRGRTKRGGAIHTRHTHGSSGRYKRLSSLFGLRDGRRHAWNHLKGGLGIKLGGGLFGLRIPRQHVLSTLSPDDYDIALHGHPNITNPYRQHMDEHPDLKGVMRNACLSVHLVVLMPRVSRTSAPSSSLSSSSATAETATTRMMTTATLPESWAELLQHLGDTISRECNAMGNGSSIITYCSTISASVTCHQPEGDALRVAAASLYEDHLRGTKLRPSPVAVTHRRHEPKRIPLLGAALSAPATLQKKAKAAVTLSELNLIGTQSQTSCILSHDKHAFTMEGEANGFAAPSAATSSAALAQRGVLQLLQDLRRSHPNALGLCMRLGEVIPTKGAAQTREEQQTPGMPARKLLREDMDPDEVGIWKRPAATVDALMRWHYFNWDPRAHCADRLPHNRRWQPVHIFVDASRVRGEVSGNQGRSGATRSLMSPHFSEKLLEMNFERADHDGLAEMLAALRGWSVDSQWLALEDRRRGLVRCNLERDAEEERQQ
ncbi:hypothetical protein DQ04_00971000 [Trypanosoma grayi]|uniref:hypothetical protein n=1 Tax=Trypanosoma grayi TaxID=71804 RepID=UPI0004F4ABDD|nr:hypothetical protein DQ04_00971000 [Trypanosoma grayi]KEG13490.1 hypothetical protein DQ04_00971000 [Trypanosoma grayi]